MSQYPLNKIDGSTVQTISLTESHHGRRPACQEPLADAQNDGGTLKLQVGCEPDEESPLAGIDLERVHNIQLLNSNSRPITEPEWLLGVDPVSGGHLHFFTDSTL